MAFAGVDDECATETYQKHLDVPRYRDCRRLLDRHANGTDAVIIATPDHMRSALRSRRIEKGFIVAPQLYILQTHAL